MAKQNMNFKNNNGGKPPKRSTPSNETMEICINESPEYISGEKEYQSLDGILSEITFNLVSIPLYAPKSFVFSDENARGKAQIGWVNGWDSENKKFSITIMGNFVGKYREMLDPSVAVKTARSNKPNEVSKIFSFILAEAYTD